MARTSKWNFEEIQATIDKHMTEAGLKSREVYSLVVPEPQRTEEEYKSFQVALSNALADGKLVGFETKKGATGGLFRAGQVPKSEGKSSFPSFPTKTVKVGSVEMKIKASGVTIKHDGKTYSKLPLREGLSRAAELLVTEGSEDARSLEDLCALVEDNVAKVVAALSAAPAQS